MPESQPLTLGAVCSKIGSGATPRGGKETYRGGATALIRSQNIYNDRFVHQGLVFIDDAQAEELSNVVVERGDVLLNITGDSVARCCQVDPDVLPARVNQHVAIIRPRPNLLDPRFLRYTLVSSSMQVRLLSLASAGATRNALTKAMIESLVIDAPPVETQRAIAQILSNLDDKIEVNRRTSATLEAVARALFRSWFVDTPRTDWTTAPLAEWVDVFSGGTPSKMNPAFWNGTRKWISPKSMTSIHADECEDYVSEQAIGNGTRVAPSGSTLVMVRGMGLHDGVRISQAREDVTFNQDVKALVPKRIEPDLLLFAMLDAQQDLHKRVETSGHGTGKMPSEILLAHPVTMPAPDVQRELSVHITALNDRIAINRSEIRSLARLREDLLPRLLSGELALAANEPTLGGAS